MYAIATVQKIARTFMGVTPRWHFQYCWKQFQQIKERFPLVRPKLVSPLLGVAFNCEIPPDVSGDVISYREGSASVECFPTFLYVPSWHPPVSSVKDHSRWKEKKVPPEPRTREAREELS